MEIKQFHTLPQRTDSEFKRKTAVAERYECTGSETWGLVSAPKKENVFSGSVFSTRIATIIIAETDNIVLAKITARLDFNHFQRNISRIFQAMGSTQGDIS